MNPVNQFVEIGADGPNKKVYRVKDKSDKAESRSYTLFKTKLGTCGIAWKEEGDLRVGPAVTAFQLPDVSDRMTAARIVGKSFARKAHSIPPQITAIIRRVKLHLGGEAQDFRDIVISLDNVRPFAKEVYAAAREIPSGRTMTYGDIAKAIKRPHASRAVGQALAKNPVPLIIPCHRVLASGNKPGGFSAPGGVATKATMLAIEGAGPADSD